MNHIKIQIKQSTSYSCQRGVSLIELMISMLVGLFLLVGVVTSFISSQDIDKKREAVSEMDVSATFAFETLRQAISHAGYASKENVPNFDKPFHTASDVSSISNPKCGDGATNRDVTLLDSTFDTKDVDTTGQDLITTIMLADNPCNSSETECAIDDGTNVNSGALVYTDCSGNMVGGIQNPRNTRTVSCSTASGDGMSVPLQATIYNTFKLFKDDGTSDQDRVLYCYGSRSDSTGLPMVDNIEAIQYLYGVREDGTGNIKFRTANQVETDSQWTMVTSVRVGLLLRSSNENVFDEDSTQTSYQVLDQAITVTDLKRLFRVYTTTINLENKNKGVLLPDA